MFRGSSFHTIDAKGRIIVPTRFRELLGVPENEGCMLTQMDNCVFGYAFEQWSIVEQRILSLAEKSDSMRRFRRIFVGSAQVCFCDKQGRLLVPPFLRQYAGLEKEIILLGVLDHFEIWSKENWERETKTLELNLGKEEVRNEIAKLGL